MAKDLATNKKARRDFHITETLEAGVQLVGTEVKSVREGKVNLQDAYARIEKGEIWLLGCNIQPWQTAAEFFQHAPRRPRKLLMHKREILKLAQLSEQKGCTLPCLRMYFKGNKVKVEIGVGKGKSHRDQRHDLKKKTEMREAQREVSRFNRQ